MDQIRNIHGLSGPGSPPEDGILAPPCFLGVCPNNITVFAVKSQSQTTQMQIPCPAVDAVAVQAVKILRTGNEAIYRQCGTRGGRMRLHRHLESWGHVLGVGGRQVVAGPWHPSRAPHGSRVPPHGTGVPQPGGTLLSSAASAPLWSSCTRWADAP